MLSSPQVVTVSGVATDLNKVQVNPLSSIYSSADGTISLNVSHQKTANRLRHMAKYSKKIVAADPISAVNESKTASVHVVIDEPIVGFSDADLDAICAGFVAWFASAIRLAILSGRH